MTPVSFVKTTEAYDFFFFFLVTINWQTSYDSGILPQDYGIILGLPVCRLGHNLSSTTKRVG